MPSLLKTSPQYPLIFSSITRCQAARAFYSKDFERANFEERQRVSSYDSCTGRPLAESIATIKSTYALSKLFLWLKGGYFVIRRPIIEGVCFEEE
jgi:hypothetical protein